MPTDRCRAGCKPVFQRITERVFLACQPFLPEFERQEPALGIIHGNNADASVSNPIESQQFLISMP